MKLVLAVGLAACTAGHVTPPSAPEPVRIVRHADAIHDQMTWRAPIELAFGQNQNGSQVVLELMREATQYGAANVSDLTFHMVFKWRGTTVSCESRTVFADDPILARKPAPAAPSAAPEAEYSTEVSSFAPREVSFTATEADLACKQVAVATTEDVPRYPNLYDATLDRIISTQVPVDRQVVRVERRDACELKPVVRAVTRYDFEKRLGYVPPKWDYLAPRFAGEPLVETAPICFAVDPATLGPQPVHRLTATLVFHGTSDHAPMRTLMVR